MNDNRQVDAVTYLVDETSRRWSWEVLPSHRGAWAAGATTDVDRRRGNHGPDIQFEVIRSSNVLLLGILLSIPDLRWRGARRRGPTQGKRRLVPDPNPIQYD